MVGGSGMFTSEDSETTFDTGGKGSSNISYLEIFPTVGYFVADKFAVGLTPSFLVVNPYGRNNSSTAYGIGPFVRYYFLKPESRINIFSQVSYSYEHWIGKFGNYTKGNKTIFKAGSAIYFNSSVALELSLAYGLENTAYSSHAESSTKIFNAGIGFQIHLEK